MDYEEYDNYKRKKYIKELKQLWLHTRLFCELEDDPTSKDVFLTMELVSYVRYEEAKSNWYHDRKSTYRSGNVEDFLLKQLDTSDSSHVNNREFWIRYQMNRSNFWNLHKKIKNHKVLHRTGCPGRKQVKSKYHLLFFSWRFRESKVVVYLIGRGIINYPVFKAFWISKKNIVS